MIKKPAVAVYDTAPIEQADASRCQCGTLKRSQNVKYLPYAFTWRVME